MVALGGGVVGDLAGFCRRDLPARHPGRAGCRPRSSRRSTRAYGGKTGVDLPEAKNYVGAYHQPAAVLSDTATLATLPAEEHAAGYAEVVKTALIAGGAAVGADRARRAGRRRRHPRLRARPSSRVVAADERDGGRRQVLNLGHTVGHALEIALGYGTLRHGEAVGLGLLAALRLSGLSRPARPGRGAAGRRRAADHAGRRTASTRSAIVAATRRDKKRTDTARTPFVLVRAPGDVVHGPGRRRRRRARSPCES